MWETIEYKKDGAVATITLNRPKAMNAMNFKMMDELPKALKDAENDRDINVIVLNHNGPHFGAGYDLKESWSSVYKGDEAVLGARNMLQYCVDYEFAPWNCTKPVIAMVRGYCLAGSCELAMMCCVTFASDNAQFGEPEIRFSTAPPAMIMPWIIGLKKSREILYTGDYLNAEEARECGMVNRVFADDKLEEETYRYARRAASISQEGLRTTKAAINRGAEIAGLRNAIDVGIDQGAMLDSTPTEVYVTFNRITKEEGLSAAIRWRETQFEE
jgi:enoyl-CoA hydratase